MSKKGEVAACLLCYLLAYVAPWFLLLSGALLSVLTSSEYWGQTAAWLVALGVAGMAISYFFARLMNAIRH